MTLHVNNAGSFIEPDEVFVKDGGAWRAITETHVNENGTWRKIFPVAGNQTFTSGTTSFVVSQGVYSLTMPIMSGAGGGARSGQHTGDCFSGYPAFAGAVVASTSFAVTPGETLTVIIGAGGIGGVYPGFQRGWNSGTPGGATSVKRGATTLYSAAGGAINNATFNSGSNFATPGPTNGSGYGTGGSGAACEGTGGAGGGGGVKFTWS